MLKGILNINMYFNVSSLERLHSGWSTLTGPHKQHFKVFDNSVIVQHSRFEATAVSAHHDYHHVVRSCYCQCSMSCDGQSMKQVHSNYTRFPRSFAMTYGS